MESKIGLANTMKESLMFSEQLIYENIFNMSSQEWTEERDRVIARKKHSVENRLKQKEMILKRQI